MSRVIGNLVMMALSVGGFGQQGDGRAAELLRQARAALGGEAALERVSGLSARGTITRAAGDVQLSGDMTVEFQLPDRMLRVDSLSPDGGLTLVSEQGFSGDDLLRATRTLNAPPGAVIRTPPPPQRGSAAEAEALRAARADLTRLALALLLRAPASQPVDFTYAGQAEAPDGSADVLDVKGRGHAFAAQLFLDRQTHLPLMLVYRGVAPRMVIRTDRGQRSPGDPDPRTTPPPSPPPADVVDITLYLDDYRRVEGILLPHHVTRSVGGAVSEEWRFSEFRVNPTFKPGTFDRR